MTRTKLLIEEWLPARAIGIECKREHQFMAPFPPNRRLHIWWARRPLILSRAAILASLLPADFNKECFDRLLGFGRPSDELVEIRALMDTGMQIDGGYGCKRAFSNTLRVSDLNIASEAIQSVWGEAPRVIDPMAGGGSIPLEGARLGLNLLANELNPVACSILEATIDYPFRYGLQLAQKARAWSSEWVNRCSKRLEPYFPKENLALVHAYLFTRTVPCPDTKFITPLVSDWHLRKPRSGIRIVAEPVIDKDVGKWTIRVREIGKGAGQLSRCPEPTYGRGKGISLFTKNPIPSEYIKAIAKQGKMGYDLYTIAIKSTNKVEFRAPNKSDVDALKLASHKLNQLRSEWQNKGIIPTEKIPDGDKTQELLRVGHETWESLFSDRQLLSLGVMVEELLSLRNRIIESEGIEMGEAIIHLFALAVDKFCSYNAIQSTWKTDPPGIRSVYERHDYAFKSTFAEMAPCISGAGLEWSINDVIKAYEDIVNLPCSENRKPIEVKQGSATHLVDIEDKSLSAVVVDPPYADNVQYSELADYFYVWLKRTQGHRRPEWFSTYLCDKTEEAVVNISRHRDGGKLSTSEAKKKAHEFYSTLMTESFREANRILCEDGVLTVMFTHKKQEAWAALFESIIAAGFTITSTWPVMTESGTSLNQARKNAAQSTVLMSARKRDEAAGRGYLDEMLLQKIHNAARSAAARLGGEGLNPIDQLVGAFGPAMEIFSRFNEVVTDTGEKVDVAEAIQAAANAVAEWRIDQLAGRGLEGIDPESRFVLLCWDVLQAVQFRFNEAMLLGRSVGMDVNTLIDAGLVAKKSDNINLLSASQRRRDTAVQESAEREELLAGVSRRRRGVKRKVHPNDEYFVSAIDMCHTLALKHAEAGGGASGIGAAKGAALQQGWTADSTCAKLMEALVHAAPQAVRFPGKGNKRTIADEFPEFQAWHNMLKPLFGINPPEWAEPIEPQMKLIEDI